MQIFRTQNSEYYLTYYNYVNNSLHYIRYKSKMDKTVRMSRTLVASMSYIN